jgi:hypothetical protein
LGAFPLSTGKHLVKVLRKRLVGVSQPTGAAAAPLTVAWGPPGLMLAKYHISRSRGIMGDVRLH